MPKLNWIHYCDIAYDAHEAEDYETAYENALQSLKLAKAEHGDELIEYVDVVSILESIYLDREQYEDAQPLIEGLMSLDKKWGEDLWEEDDRLDFYLDAVECWLGLATRQMDYYQFDEAEENLLRALQLVKENNLEKDSIALFDEMGTLCELTGQYAEAESSYRLALRQLAQEDFPDYRFFQVKLAHVLSYQGNFKEADGLFVEAITTIKQELGKDNLDYIWALEKYLPHLKTLQQHSRVLTYALHCMDTYREQLGKEHPQYLSAAQEVTRVAMHAGIYDDVETVLLECKAVYENMENEDSNYFSLLLQLGIYYRDVNEFDKAEHYIEQSMQYVEDKIGKHHPAYASALSNLAALYTKKGDLQAAIICFEKNLALKKAAFGTSHPFYAEALGSLGEVYIRANEPGKALECYKKAGEIQLDQLSKLFAFQGETERMRVFDQSKYAVTHFNLLANQFIDQEPALTRRMFDDWLFIKAALFQTTKAFKASAENIRDPEIISLYEDWMRKKRYFAKLYDYSNTDDDHHNYLNQLERRIAKDEKKLAQTLTNFNPGFSATSGFEKVKQVLKPGEAVLEIQRLGGFATFEGCYIALLVTSETKHPVLVELGSIDNLEKTTLPDYRKYLEKRSGSRSLRVKQGFSLTEKKAKLSKSLYTVFWQPLATALQEIKVNGRIYLSADGIYNQLNVNTLLNPDSGNFVIDEWDIHQVTSSRELLDGQPQSHKQATQKTAVLLGYPTYYMSIPYELYEDDQDHDDTPQRYESRYVGKGKIRDLPGTKEEVESLDKLLQKAGWETTVLLGRSATEHAIKSLEKTQILHLATHGFFLPSGTMDMDKPADVPVNALFHTGLLFAGAGLSLKGRIPEGVFYQLQGNEDGIFSAYEASLLDLKNTELVVLSACETGLGVLRDGEGVYGFQRAFLEAGASCLLCSLWKIDDQATKEMMLLFYTFWLSGMSKRQAFKNAQQKLRESWPSPYYWGAFVMLGE